MKKIFLNLKHLENKRFNQCYNDKLSNELITIYTFDYDNADCNYF